VIGTTDPWPLSPREAVALQRDLASRVVRRTRSRTIRHVGGADVAVVPERRLALASIVVLTFPELEVVESSEGAAPLDFPYIPGLLSFREMPAILAALPAIWAWYWIFPRSGARKAGFLERIGCRPPPRAARFP